MVETLALVVSLAAAAASAFALICADPARLRKLSSSVLEYESALEQHRVHTKALVEYAERELDEAKRLRARASASQSRAQRANGGGSGSESAPWLDPGLSDADRRSALASALRGD